MENWITGRKQDLASRGGLALNTEYGNSRERFHSILVEMAAETPEERVARWQGRFDQLTGSAPDGLVLFGAGHFGQWALGRLRKAGSQPCCISDNNPATWGSLVDGIEVLSPADAVRRFGQTACFVVTVYNGSAARKQLRQLGCSQVLPATYLFWKYPADFMAEHGINSPDLLAQDVEQIRQCFALLSDEPSRQEFCDQIEWRYWMNPEYLPSPTDQGELYYPSDLVAENDQEVLVDCGAFDGDSIRSFIRRGKSFQHLYALEPDTANLEGLRASLSSYPDGIREKITVWPYALGDKDEVVSFIETHDQASKVTSSNEGTAIESRRLDSLPWQDQPTYIKMDIEAWEPFALAGGAELIKREMPVLAICIYHRSEHLWQIPNLIHSLAPGYSFYLRRYAEDCWEQICYAVPPSRTKA
jgi:FkbM family methyltransferase